MNRKVQAGLILLLALLAVAAVTGVPHLKQPGLVDSITLIVFFLIEKR